MTSRTTQSMAYRNFGWNGVGLSRGRDGYANRPPHGSARAALPHTALTLDSGIEACFTSRPPRNPWDTDFPALCRARVEFTQRSPWSALFPPPPPPRQPTPLCSAASSVLQRGPTPQRRACPACGLSPSWTGPRYGGTPQSWAGRVRSAAAQGHRGNPAVRRIADAGRVRRHGCRALQVVHAHHRDRTRRHIVSIGRRPEE
jgi:hypothetical protein